MYHPNLSIFINIDIIMDDITVRPVENDIL